MSLIPPHIRRVFSSTLIYGLAGYIPRLLNLLILPLYTIYLAPEVLGTVELFITITTVAVAVFQFGIPTAYARLYFDETDRIGRDNLFYTAFIGTFITTAVGSLTLVVLSGPLFDHFADGVEVHPWLEVVIASSFCQVIIDLTTRQLQNQERATLVARIGITYGIGSTFSRAIAIFLFEASYGGILFAEMIVSCLVALFLLLQSRELRAGTVDWKQLMHLFKVGAPFTPYKIIMTITVAAPLWLLSRFGMRDIVGIIGIAQRAASPMMIAFTAFGKGFAPVYYSWRNDMLPQETKASIAEERQQHIKSVANTVLTVAALAAIGALTLGRLAIVQFTDERYHLAAIFIAFYCGGHLFRFVHSIVGTELMYQKKTVSIAITSLIAGLFSVVVCVIGIPELGAAGALLGISANPLALSIGSFVYAIGSPATKAFSRGVLAFSFALCLCLYPIELVWFKNLAAYIYIPLAWFLLSLICLRLGGVRMRDIKRPRKRRM